MSAFLSRFVKSSTVLSDTSVGLSYTRIRCLWKRWKTDESKTKSVSVEEIDEDEDKPVKYTTSDAHKKWKSAYNFRVLIEEDPYPRYQWPVIATSITALLVYFGVLREENDVDELLKQPLYERFPQFERTHLEQAIYNHRMMGKDTTELEQKLKQLTE